MLLSAGRNCSVADMQLLETKSMGQVNAASHEYQICAYWNPREPQYAILNEETQKNMKVGHTQA